MGEKFGSLDRPGAHGRAVRDQCRRHAAATCWSASACRRTPAPARVRTSSRRRWRPLRPSSSMICRTTTSQVHHLACRPSAMTRSRARRRLDVYTGRRVRVASRTGAAMRASSPTMRAGALRARRRISTDVDQARTTALARAIAWKLLNDENVSGTRIEDCRSGSPPITAPPTCRPSREQGPDAHRRASTWPPASASRPAVDPVSDPVPAILHRPGTANPGRRGCIVPGTPASSASSTRRPRPKRRLYRGLEAAFGGDTVFVTLRAPDDGQTVAGARLRSRRNPGDFFLLRHQTPARPSTCSAAASGSTRAPDDPGCGRSSFKARDGLSLHGFLTLPAGGEGTRRCPWW